MARSWCSLSTNEGFDGLAEPHLVREDPAPTEHPQDPPYGLDLVGQRAHPGHGGERQELVEVSGPAQPLGPQGLTDGLKARVGAPQGPAEGVQHRGAKVGRGLDEVGRGREGRRGREVRSLDDFLGFVGFVAFVGFVGGVGLEGFLGWRPAAAGGPRGTPIASVGRGNPVALGVVDAHWGSAGSSRGSPVGRGSSDRPGRGDRRWGTGLPRRAPRRPRRWEVPDPGCTGRPRGRASGPRCGSPAPRCPGAWRTDR